jgi:hypothetical protein
MSRTHYKSLINTTFLGQWDLTDSKTGKTFEPTVEIAEVRPYVAPRARRKRMPDGSWKDIKEHKLDIAFKGKKKHWLANAGGRDTIAAMYGNFIEDWIGKRITIYVDASVTFGSKKTGGIRVRPMVPGSNVPTTLEPMDEPVDEAKAEELDAALEWAEKESDS